MQDYTGEEALADLVGQPREVPGVPARTWGGGGLDLDTHYSSSRELGHQVDLVAALLGPQVKEARVRVGDGEFGAQLGGHERVEHTPQHVAVRSRRVSRRLVGLSLSCATSCVSRSSIKLSSHALLAPPVRPQGGIWETAVQRKLHVAAQVGALSRNA